MTERDGSKARASAICILREHLLWMVAGLPKKRLSGAYFGSKTLVTPRRCLGKVAIIQGREEKP